MDLPIGPTTAGMILQLGWLFPTKNNGSFTCNVDQYWVTQIPIFFLGGFSRGLDQQVRYVHQDTRFFFLGLWTQTLILGVSELKWDPPQTLGFHTKNGLTFGWFGLSQNFRKPPFQSQGQSNLSPALLKHTLFFVSNLEHWLVGGFSHLEKY